MSLRILIVEDNSGMVTVMQQLVSPLLLKFPGSIVTVAHEMEEALSAIRTVPLPDIVLLDLSLPDSTIEETILRIDEIESQCPVLIVTGHAIDRVRKLIARPVEVVEKINLNEPGLIIRVMIKVIAAWHEGRFDRIQRNLLRMREIVNGATETK